MNSHMLPLCFGRVASIIPLAADRRSFFNELLCTQKCTQIAIFGFEALRPAVRNPLDLFGSASAFVVGAPGLEPGTR
jgi:hypothetical protein